MKIKKKRGPRKKRQAMAQQHRKVGSIIVCGREGAASSTRSPRLVGPEKQEPKRADDGPWIWPIDLSRYDRSGSLTAIEQDRLPLCAEAYRFHPYGRRMDFGPELDRLVPLNDVLDYTGIITLHRKYTLVFLLPRDGRAATVLLGMERRRVD
jgi:hypothetical protein